MSITFGLGSLRVLENLTITGAAVTTGTAGTGLAVTSGLAIIDGVTATISGQSASVVIAGSTGTGLLLYAFIANGDTTTASLAVFTAGHPANVATNFPTAIAPLAKFSFGTGASVISDIVAFSGGSATKVIGKVQNVSINVTYENSQMRGGGDIFPVDTQHFDGSIEGSFEFADQTATQLLFFGGVYSSAGSASGTWTLSGSSKPNAVSLNFQNVTNGVTSTYIIRKSYLMQSTNDFARTEYMNPTWNFIGEANNQGDALIIEG